MVILLAPILNIHNLKFIVMSKTTDWYLELEENGTLSLYVSSVMFDNNEIEEVEAELVKQEDIS